MIVGAAAGSWIIATPIKVIKASFAGIKGVFKGPKYQRQLFWAVVIGFVVLFAPFAIRHLTIVFTH